MMGSTAGLPPESSAYGLHWAREYEGTGHEEGRGGKEGDRGGKIRGARSPLVSGVQTFALPSSLLPLHSGASASPASRPNAASSSFLPPKRQRAPTRDCSVGSSSR